MTALLSIPSGVPSHMTAVIEVARMLMGRRAARERS